MLRFAEEILLLLLRDDSGRFVAVPGTALDNRAVAAAAVARGESAPGSSD